jgi:tRNA pseudouridine38-40 synthase
VSLKLLLKDNITAMINQELPPAIRVVKYLRVGKTFNPKAAASSRTYLYFIPSFAFATPAELASLEAPSEAPLEATEAVGAEVVGVDAAAKDVLVKTSVEAGVAVEGEEVKTEDVVEGEEGHPFEREDPAVAKARQSREQARLKAFRLPQEGRDRLAGLLQGYVGTKNFHNFTAKKDPLDKSNIRYIMGFGVQQVFVHEGMEFVHLQVLMHTNMHMHTRTYTHTHTLTHTLTHTHTRTQVHGQSFMLHQIRKMVGLVVAVTRGLVPDTMLIGDKATGFEMHRKRVPTAPSLGLLLDRPHFKSYDDKLMSENDVGDKETFEKAFASCQTELDAFKAQHIISHICKAELESFSCVQFLEDLHTEGRNWGCEPQDLKDVTPPEVLARWDEKKKLDQAARRELSVARVPSLLQNTIPQNPPTVSSDSLPVIPSVTTPSEVVPAHATPPSDFVPAKTS